MNLGNNRHPREIGGLDEFKQVPAFAGMTG
jgi:hypothetical protein